MASGMRWSILAATSLLAACASSPGRETTTSVPPAPGYLREVEVAPPRNNENALSVLEREQNARLEQNTIICAARSDWERMRAGLAGGALPDTPVCATEESQQ